MEEYKFILQKGQTRWYCPSVPGFFRLRTFHFLGICRVKRFSPKEPGKSEKITSSTGVRRQFIEKVKPVDHDPLNTDQANYMEIRFKKIKSLCLDGYGSCCTACSV